MEGRASVSTVSKGAGARKAEGGTSASAIGERAGARRAKQTRTSRCRRISRSSGSDPHWLQFLPVFGSRQCKDGGGAGICQNNRRRSLCKECGEASICQHPWVRDQCKDCGGGSFCQHNRRDGEGAGAKSARKVYGGARICEHKRIGSKCKNCTRSSCFQA